jgi:cytidylate kinase
MNNKTVQVPVIAIDGPSGSGKGTVATRLAMELGWHLLDSGALYRLVSLAVLRMGLDTSDGEQLAKLTSEFDIRFEPQPGGATRISLNGEDVSSDIRAETVGNMASQIAAIAPLRKALRARQRAFRQLPGLVADGRDMGTIIFPDAVLKIFLTASVEERAQRRYKQLKTKGESVNLPRLFREIEERDNRDRSRPIAPLVPADDAVFLDSTGLSIEQVLAEIRGLMGQRNITP